MKSKSVKTPNLESSEEMTIRDLITNPEKRAPGYESWWDVPISEVSELSSVKKARREFEAAVKKERFFW